MPTALPNWCFSVDEPIRGSTPALRHPWLARHTNTEVLIDHRCRVHDLYTARL